MDDFGDWDADYSDSWEPLDDLAEWETDQVYADMAAGEMDF